MPLNLHLVRRNYPELYEPVASLAVSLGSILNINGTLICCFVMTPAICTMLGLPIGVAGLLLCLPVIYVVGFGVPGVPGELILFAGPILEALQVPAELHSLFLLAFLGLQIGLPDSFRTGANSTDNVSRLPARPQVPRRPGGPGGGPPAPRAERLRLGAMARRRHPPIAPGETATGTGPGFEMKSFVPGRMRLQHPFLARFAAVAKQVNGTCSRPRPSSTARSIR